MKTKKQPKNKKKQHSLIIFSQIGFQMLIIIALGVFVGYKLDQSYPNQYQVFSIIFSIAAIIYSIYYVIRQVSSRSDKNSNK